MNVSEPIRVAQEGLSPAERKVAEVVNADPEAVAFGTVAEVAARAGTSGPTVVRFAERLGYQGFVGLQAAVRANLSERLRPAVQRIRGDADASVLERTLAVEISNVRKTLEGIDPRAFRAAVHRLADPRRRIGVLPSEQCRSPGSNFATELGLLRDDVHLLFGSQFRVATQIGHVRARDTVVLIDLRRHERWVVEASARVAEAGAHRIVVSDSPLSELARGAEHFFAVAAEAAGPFDSSIGIQALLNALVAGVAEKVRPVAAKRLDALEAAWVKTGALVE
jgi:DNA-binding MurR/RpiR family transcriptional regulator